jgi:hypothetical protein
MPEPSNRMLLGSGTDVVVLVVVVVVLLLVPRTVNDSDGIEPTEFSEAIDGPEFSSQKTGSPLGTLAFCRFTQKVPELSVGPLKVVFSWQTL